MIGCPGRTFGRMTPPDLWNRSANDESFNWDRAVSSHRRANANSDINSGPSSFANAHKRKGSARSCSVRSCGARRALHLFLASGRQWPGLHPRRAEPRCDGPNDQRRAPPPCSKRTPNTPIEDSRQPTENISPGNRHGPSGGRARQSGPSGQASAPTTRPQHADCPWSASSLPSLSLCFLTPPSSALASPSPSNTPHLPPLDPCVEATSTWLLPPRGSPNAKTRIAIGMTSRPLYCHGDERAGPPYFGGVWGRGLRKR
jgi:hypothetical protein